MTKFISQNEATYKLMTKLGFTQLTSPAGFVGSLAGFSGVAFVLYAVSSFRRCHEDEEAERLDLPYAAPVTRSSWLGAEVGTTLAALLAVALVAVVSTSAPSQEDRVTDAA